MDIIRESRRPILLRPQKSDSSEMNQYLGDGSAEGADDVVGYRIWQATAAVRAWAKAQRDHDKRRPTCPELVRASAREEKTMGLVTAEKLVCDRCGYGSSSQKFYDEIKRDGPGGRTPVINMAAQLALADCPMAVSSSGFRQMMATMDLPVPSEPALQNLANKYSDIMEEENEKNIKRWIQVMKRVKALKGYKPDSPIRGQADTRYHTPLGNLSGRKPGQPSDSNDATFVEEVTTRNKVIAYHLKVKTCRLCTIYRGHGLEPPPHKCSANTLPQAPIGNEEESGEKMARDLLESNVRASASGLGSHHRWRQSNFQRDGQGAKAESRSRVKHRFANDLVQRLNAEHEAALAQLGMRTRHGVERAMDKAMQAIPHCYAGNHDWCLEYSLVCRHPSRWRFHKINAEARGQINPNPSDCKLLRGAMEMRLGKKALELTRHFANTNKAESVNRQISKSAPKNITHFHTLAGRLASALHSSNNGTGHSVVMKRLAAGIPLSPKSKAVRVLEKMRERQDYKRSYKKEPANKKRENANIMEKFEVYDECRERGTYKSAEVAKPSKGTRESPRKRAREDGTDHGYSRG
ncbi:Hypp570 [Branchiostoma lanceolatum]|uniref:Hypp570 protein n=1 Tax=Branchiostoma lanceolatum TaxID=7740 RepID=A0A8J9YJW9_BRALA|nr:Hypp570 [Branchiostoma lanceolatum]